MPASHDWKVAQYLIEVLIESDGSARASQLIIEYGQLTSARSARISQLVIEYVQKTSARFARVSQLIIEIAEENTPLYSLDECVRGQNFTF